MSPHQPIVTKSGKILPISDLKGKPYLQVAYRLVWFREEHPDWTIDTQIIDHRSAEYAVVEASILNDQGRLIAKDRKVVTAKSFQAYIEKATTGAIGRVLALCGYGTQFEPEIDEEGVTPADAVDSALDRPTHQDDSWILGKDDLNLLIDLQNQAGWQKEQITLFYQSLGYEKISSIKKFEFDTLCRLLKYRIMRKETQK